ncbi:MAG: InlB B-repeat-containing protein [Firmicutes bacterium]|nr:InlB B-repeat-containing protein [Bacillota bacterium]
MKKLIILLIVVLLASAVTIGTLAGTGVIFADNNTKNSKNTQSNPDNSTFINSFFYLTTDGVELKEYEGYFASFILSEKEVGEIYSLLNSLVNTKLTKAEMQQGGVSILEREIINFQVQSAPRDGVQFVSGYTTSVIFNTSYADGDIFLQFMHGTTDARALVISVPEKFIAISNFDFEEFMETDEDDWGKVALLKDKLCFTVVSKYDLPSEVYFVNLANAPERESDKVIDRTPTPDYWCEHGFMHPHDLGGGCHSDYCLGYYCPHGQYYYNYNGDDCNSGNCYYHCEHGYFHPGYMGFDCHYEYCSSTPKDNEDACELSCEAECFCDRDNDGECELGCEAECFCDTGNEDNEDACEFGCNAECFFFWETGNFCNSKPEEPAPLSSAKLSAPQMSAPSDNYVIITIECSEFFYIYADNPGLLDALGSGLFPLEIDFGLFTVAFWDYEFSLHLLEGLPFSFLRFDRITGSISVAQYNHIASWSARCYVGFSVPWDGLHSYKGSYFFYTIDDDAHLLSERDFVYSFHFLTEPEESAPSPTPGITFSLRSPSAPVPAGLATKLINENPALSIRFFSHSSSFPSFWTYTRSYAVSVAPYQGSSTREVLLTDIFVPLSLERLNRLNGGSFRVEIRVDWFITGIPPSYYHYFTVGTTPNTQFNPSHLTYSLQFPPAVELPPNPEKEGHTFIGWFLNEDLTVPYSGQLIYEDTELFAGWQILSFTVSFNVDGGSAVSSHTVDWNTAVAKPANPVKNGYTLNGWFADSARTVPYNFNTPVKSDITLYADWEPIILTVTFYSNGAVYETVEVPWGATLQEAISAVQSNSTVLTAIYSDFRLSNPANPATVLTSNAVIYAELGTNDGSTNASFWDSLGNWFSVNWLAITICATLLLVASCASLFIVVKKR